MFLKNIKGLSLATAQYLLGVAVMGASIGTASAAALLYSDFSDLSGLQLNGATASIHGGSAVTGYGTVTDSAGNKVLRLTNTYWQSGSAFSTNQISLDLNASFSTAFKFRFSDQQSGGADGIVFTVQTNSNTAGGVGGGIGYAGIGNSVGVEFDNWYNGGLDPNANHAGINVGGSVNSVVNTGTSLVPQLDNGDIWTAWVDYDGATDVLEVRANITGVRPSAALLSYTIDLTAELGQTDAFVGFTSGTGAAGADHDILQWQFNSSYDPIEEIGTATAPAPGSIALLALGLLGAGVARKRRS